MCTWVHTCGRRGECTAVSRLPAACCLLLPAQQPTLTYWVLEPSGQRSMRAADGSLLSMMVTSKLQKLPGAAASPAARAAWAASYAAARPLQLAHLAAGWFERGFGLPPDPPRVAELVAGWPVMEAGRFFEAAWHDEAADCCAFVPNAELAHRYPDG